MKINFKINCNELYFTKYKKKLEKAHIALHNEEEPILNWVTAPISSNVLLDRLNATNYKKLKYDTLIIVGSGGSINPSRALLSTLEPKVNVVYLSDFSNLSDTLHSITGRPLFHIMSQSGNTLETNFALSQIVDYLKAQKLKLNEHIFISTSNMQGSLYQFARDNNIQNVVTPNVVGRLSALSCHLINVILAKLDIKAFVSGAKDAYFELYKSIDNPCYRFAVSRLYNENIRRKHIEIVSTSSHSLDAFQDWYCQLFSESEGKNNKGAIPMKIKYPEHLHSYEQFFQQGKRLFFETMFVVKNEDDKKFTSDNSLLKNMHGKTYDEINTLLVSSVATAHNKAKIPCNIIEIESLDEYTFGYLFYFFHKACVMACMLQDINPYTQSGVDNYKKLLM